MNGNSITAGSGGSGGLSGLGGIRTNGLRADSGDPGNAGADGMAQGAFIYNASSGSIRSDRELSNIYNDGGLVEQNDAPDNLTLTSDQDSYHPFQTAEITGNVRDLDGNEDLAKVVVWVGDSSNNWVSFEIENFDENGNFTYGLELENRELGTYNIWAKAEDQQGSSSDWINYSFTISNNAPSNLTFTSNDDSYHPLQTPEITGTVTDPDGINDLAKLVIWLQDANGNWFDVEITDFGDDGSFSYELGLEGYQPENYTMWAQAEDKQGGVSDWIDYRFTVTNNAPNNVIFTSNNDSYHPLQTPEITGTVTDPDGINDLAKLVIWLQDADNNWFDVEITDFGDDGSFSYELDLEGYQTGNYSMWAQAEDKQGAVSDWISKNFSVENQAPSDLSLDLNKDSYNPSETLDITGTVMDGDGNEDLALIDHWIQQPDGAWIHLSSTEEFGDNGEFSQELTLPDYQLGDYQLYSSVQDQQGAVSEWIFNTFSVENDASMGVM